MSVISPLRQYHAVPGYHCPPLQHQQRLIVTWSNPSNTLDLLPGQYPSLSYVIFIEPPHRNCYHASVSIRQTWHDEESLRFHLETVRLLSIRLGSESSKMIWAVILFPNTNYGNQYLSSSSTAEWPGFYTLVVSDVPLAGNPDPNTWLRLDAVPSASWVN